MAGGKKKKEKKAPKETKEQLSAVDKTFYELTIADLNNKLAHLRSHNATLAERNVELETAMVQLTEDRSDITAYLNRTLETQTNHIKDFEEKLSQLAKVRADETTRFQQKIHDWETKYKTMHDQLTSEIKLLTGKLNSLEEFRIQKDELMAKFDQQETDLKEQNQRHNDTLYELERKQILDKDRLKNEVETRLLQLSNEFAKSNGIRLSAHVQRMLRENIALNNELDRLVTATERLMADNKRICTQNNEQRLYMQCVLDENARLIAMSQKRLRIIEKLTTECERMKGQVQVHVDADKQRQRAEVREMTVRKELMETKNRILSMQTDVIGHKRQTKTQLGNIIEYKNEIKRLTTVLRRLKQAITDVLEIVDRADAVDADVDSGEWVQMQRKRLLNEIQNSLMGVEVDETDDFSEKDGGGSERTKTPLAVRDSYQRGRIGIAPARQSTQQLIKYSHSTYKGRKASGVGTGGDALTGRKGSSARRQSMIGSVIFDVVETILPETESMRIDDSDSIPSDGRTPEPIPAKPLATRSSTDDDGENVEAT